MHCSCHGEYTPPPTIYLLIMISVWDAYKRLQIRCNVNILCRCDGTKWWMQCESGTHFELFLRVQTPCNDVFWVSTWFPFHSLFWKPQKTSLKNLFLQQKLSGSNCALYFVLMLNTTASFHISRLTGINNCFTRVLLNDLSNQSEEITVSIMDLEHISFVQIVLFEIVVVIRKEF